MINIYRLGQFVILLTIFALGQAQAQETVVQELWTSCAQCHATPDLRVAGDKGWLALNRKTSCLTGAAAAPAVREALIAFLQSDVRTLPRLITEAHKPEAKKGFGLLEVPAAAGSAYLIPVPQNGALNQAASLRLSWKDSESGSTLRIPQGQYRVVNYGFHRADAKGNHWKVSCTPGEAGQVVQAAADVPPTLAASDTLHSQLTAVSTKKGFNLKFFPSDNHGNRMTLTKNGALVTPHWVISSTTGNAMDRGKFVVL